MFKSLKTVDYDYDPKHFRDKTSFEHVLAKIRAMPCCEGITVKDSNTKGKHIIIECSIINCDICRMVYDDPVRYSKDVNRPTYAQNVLFDKKDIPLTQDL